jgi:hypothetical protein
MFISVTTKFPDILGTDWTCKDEPPLSKTECPNYTGIGPELINTTGEWMCRKCFKIIGHSNGTDDEIQEDDAIDDENSGSGVVEYTAEGDKNVDFTPEQGARYVLFEKNRKIASEINTIDQKFSIYLLSNEYEIVNMVRKLTKANVPGFESIRGKALSWKILAVASHFMKRLPFSEAMRVLKIKQLAVSKRKTVVDDMYRTDIDNPMTRNINDIGTQLDVPISIINQATEAYEKTSPTNRESKPLAVAAAWLFLFARKTKYTIHKKDFNKIPNLSRSALNNAIASFRDLPQS